MNLDSNQLGYRERDKLFKKYFTDLKIKVTLNWFELIALLTVSFFGGFKLLVLMGLSNKSLCIIAAFAISLMFTFFLHQKI